MEVLEDLAGRASSLEEEDDEPSRTLGVSEVALNDALDAPVDDVQSVLVVGT